MEYFLYIEWYQEVSRDYLGSINCWYNIDIRKSGISCWAHAMCEALDVPELINRHVVLKDKLVEIPHLYNTVIITAEIP